MSKPFGYSYLLDMYQCIPGSCDNLEVIYRMLERLPAEIDMEIFSPPLLIHGPTTFSRLPDGTLDRKEDYEDKTGVSGVIFLITSSIVLHTIEPKNFATIDCYSCNCFDPKIVHKVCQECFGFTSCDEQFLERGKSY